MQVVTTTLLCFVVLLEIFMAQSAVEIASNCIEETAPLEDKLKAFIGWPYALDCGVFFQSEDYGVFDLYEDLDYDFESDVICEIRDGNGELLLNSSSSFDALQSNGEDIGVIVLPDLKADDNVNFNLTLRVPTISKCLHMKIKLQLTEFREQTCQDSLGDDLMSPIPSSRGHLKIFTCEVPKSVYPKLNSIENKNEFVYHWTRNCSGLPTGVKVYNGNTTLRIPSLTFDQGGIYTCAVEYKGMTRYLSSASVCVEHSQTFVTPSFVCKQSEYYEIVGDNVVIQCFANFGTGSISPNSFYVHWKNHQENETTSLILCGKPTEVDSAVASKTSCTYKLPESKCYFSPPSDEERIPPPALLEVELIIRNIQLSDFGRYESVLGVIIEDSSRIKTNITVIQKYKASAHKSSIPGLSFGVIAGIIIGGIIFIVITLTAFITCKRTTIQRPKKLKEEERKEKEMNV